MSDRDDFYTVIFSRLGKKQGESSGAGNEAETGKRISG
jgi:hypothetical protein